MNKNISEIEKLEKEKDLLSLLRSYEGEDRVLPAQEIADELSKEPAVNINSGIKDLDDIIGGFRLGQVVVISAATGVGKTTWCQFMTRKLEEQGQHSIWFSYEVGPQEFLEKIPNTLFYMPRRLTQNNIHWLETRIVEGIAKYNSRIVFIDHLHYLLDMKKMAEAKSISLLIGQLMRDLKKMAVEKNILIFIISHIKKIDAGAKPELEDLRDSSFTAQESDAVIMLGREHLADPNIPGVKNMTNTTYVIVRKNRRTGKLGSVKYIYNELTREYEKPLIELPPAHSPIRDTQENTESFF